MCLHSEWDKERECERESRSIFTASHNLLFLTISACCSLCHPIPRLPHHPPFILAESLSTPPLHCVYTTWLALFILACSALSFVVVQSLGLFYQTHAARMENLQSELLIEEERGRQVENLKMLLTFQKTTTTKLLPSTHSTVLSVALYEGELE